MEKYDIVLSGLGGQGVMTISQVLAAAACSEGIPVKLFEGTGITQRGGGVYGFVRLGKAFSPRIPEGRADAIISLEISEIASVINYLKPQGEIWTSSSRIHGYYSKLRPGSYPSQERLKDLIRLKTSNFYIIPAHLLAIDAGSPQAINMVITGAFLGATPILGTESITRAIEGINRPFAEQNLGAFWKGFAFVKKEKAA